MKIIIATLTNGQSETLRYGSILIKNTLMVLSLVGWLNKPSVQLWSLFMETQAQQCFYTIVIAAIATRNSKPHSERQLYWRPFLNSPQQYADLVLVSAPITLTCVATNMTSNKNLFHVNCILECWI